ncbi:MAG TPA: hypothetical protein VD948_08840 [Rhodothermales bacterium]|nr:hypothetical protein [Rhodothermales bacterium]
MTKTLIQMDLDTYVRRGVQMPGLTCQQWSEKFKALGGTVCLISAADMDRVARTAGVRVEGAPEAIEFVRQSVEATK